MGLVKARIVSLIAVRMYARIYLPLLLDFEIDALGVLWSIPEYLPSQSLIVEAYGWRCVLHPYENLRLCVLTSVNS